MAMSVGSGGEGAPMMEINTTPLIDVMLVLIIVLIMSIPIMTHATKLDMPQTNNPPPPVRPEVIEIDVDFDGTIAWNHELVPTRGDLQARLYRIAQQPDQPEVHLRPNKLVTYKYVAMVMAEAQRLGVTKIGIVGNEQFMN